MISVWVGACQKLTWSQTFRLLDTGFFLFVKNLRTPLWNAYSLRLFNSIANIFSGKYCFRIFSEQFFCKFSLCPNCLVLHGRLPFWKHASRAPASLEISHFLLFLAKQFNLLDDIWKLVISSTTPFVIRIM